MTRANCVSGGTRGSISDLTYAVAAVLILCATTAPVLSGSLPAVAEGLYRILAWTCHQAPDRCPDFGFGRAGLCVRCLSVCGAMVAARLGLGRSSRGGYALAAGLWIPMAIDGATAFGGWRESRDALRVLTGGLAGIGLHVFTGALRRQFRDSNEGVTCRTNLVALTEAATTSGRASTRW